MTESSSQIPLSSVECYFDPVCPFAWITSRWLVELSGRVPIRLDFKLMSLGVLNEGAELDADYRQRIDASWGPSRFVAAYALRYGDAPLAELYTALGTKIHRPGIEPADYEKIIASVVDELGLPRELLDEAASQEAETLLRERHAASQLAIGMTSGTPIVVIDGRANFGPVLSSVPRGDSAVALFEAVRTLSSHPEFSEIKRPREPLALP